MEDVTELTDNLISVNCSLLEKLTEIERLLNQPKPLTICSWNFDPGTLLKEKKQYFLRTMDIIRPSVLLLQEPFWLHSKIQQMVVPEEDSKDLFKTKWGVTGVGTQVAILYDNSRITKDDQTDEKVRRTWVEAVGEIEQKLARDLLTKLIMEDDLEKDLPEKERDIRKRLKALTGYVLKKDVSDESIELLCEKFKKRLDELTGGDLKQDLSEESIKPLREKFRNRLKKCIQNDLKQLPEKSTKLLRDKVLDSLKEFIGDDLKQLSEESIKLLREKFLDRLNKFIENDLKQLPEKSTKLLREKFLDCLYNFIGDDLKQLSEESIKLLREKFQDRLEEFIGDDLKQVIREKFLKRLEELQPDDRDRLIQDVLETLYTPLLTKRTQSLSAKVKLGYPNQTEETTVIFISVHMPYKCKMEIRQELGNAMLREARTLCRKYGKLVIIGADWNCPFKDLTLPDNCRRLPTDVRGLDGVVILSPTASGIPLVRSAEFFHWESGDKHGEEYEKVYTKKHRPIKCELVLQRDTRLFICKTGELYG